MSKLTNMTIEELEETLQEILPVNFELKHTKKGIVIYTFLVENEYGELIPVDEEEDEDEDSMFDEDTESLTEDVIDE